LNKLIIINQTTKKGNNEKVEQKVNTLKMIKLIKMKVKINAIRLKISLDVQMIMLEKIIKLD